MTYYDQNALKLCHAFWRERLRPGMTCVDATAGGAGMPRCCAV